MAATSRLLLLLAVALAGGVACGGDADGEARVYLVDGGPTSAGWRGRLSPYGTAGSPEQAVRATLRGPAAAPDGRRLVSAAPKGTSFEALDLAGGVATVRLAAPGGAPVRWGTAGYYLTAQLVFTLSGFRSVERVAVLVEGRPCCLYRHDGRPIARPLGREAFAGWQGAPGDPAR